jgi:hypothetical protein
MKNTFKALLLTLLLAGSAAAQVVISGGGGGSGGSVGTAFFASTYGVKANWQVESNGANFTVTSGSPTLTCTTCIFTAADTGKSVFYSTWTGTDSAYSSANAGPLSAATLTFVNATTATMSVNGSGNVGTTNGNVGLLAWGTDDNAAWAVAKAAAYDGINCQTIQFAGISDLTAAQFLTATCRGIAGGSTASKYPGVTGFGVGAGATFLLPPWFNSAGCTGALSGTACFGLGEWANVTFNTLGAAGDITVNKNIFETINDGSYRDLAFWGGFAASPPQSFFQLDGGAHIVMDITVDGGSTPCIIGNNTFAFWNGIFCGNGKSNTGSVVINSTSGLTSYSMGYTMGPNGTAVDNSGFFEDYGSIYIGTFNSGSACIKSESGAHSYTHGLYCDNAATAGSVALWAVSGGYMYSDSAFFLNGGATNGAHLCPAGSTCETGMGNKYGATGAGIIGCAVNSVSPAACAGNSTGAFVVPISTTTYTVNTTAVTTSSSVLLTPRTYTGNLPGTPTCVAPAVTSAPVVSAISVGVSFTITLPTIASQTCWDYKVSN